MSAISRSSSRVTTNGFISYSTFTSRHQQGLGWVSARRVWAIASFGGILSKMRDAVVTFIFLDWLGKVVFIFVLSVVRENG